MSWTFFSRCPFNLCSCEAIWQDSFKRGMTVGETKLSKERKLSPCHWKNIGQSAPLIQGFDDGLDLIDTLLQAFRNLRAHVRWEGWVCFNLWKLKLLHDSHLFLSIIIIIITTLTLIFRRFVRFVTLLHRWSCCCIRGRPCSCKAVYDPLFLIFCSTTWWLLTTVGIIFQEFYS